MGSAQGTETVSQASDYLDGASKLQGDAKDSRVGVDRVSYWMLDDRKRNLTIKGLRCDIHRFRCDGQSGSLYMYNRVRHE